MYNIEKTWRTTNISTDDTKITHSATTSQHKQNMFLTPMPVFSPQSRDELKRAADDVCSEGNRPTMLHGPIGKWDVSQVTDMSKIFFEENEFNYEISNWDVSRVTDMREMFFFAKSFNQDLSNWDVSRVVDFQWMFADANSFHQTLCGAAWVNSNASKVEMFDASPGSISNAVCGAWCVIWSFVFFITLVFILLSHMLT